jgi:hypothetical protein
MNEDGNDLDEDVITLMYWHDYKPSVIMSNRYKDLRTFTGSHCKCSPRA